jgi:hypothetical protein
MQHAPWWRRNLGILSLAPQRADGASLPWSLDIATTLPSIVGSIVAQGDSDSMGHRILVDGVVTA